MTTMWLMRLSGDSLPLSPAAGRAAIASTEASAAGTTMRARGFMSFPPPQMGCPMTCSSFLLRHSVEEIKKVRLKLLRLSNRRSVPTGCAIARLYRIDFDVAALNSDLERWQRRKPVTRLVARLAVSVEGGAVARAFEPVAELAVVEDAAHVRADSGERRDLRSSPDQEAFDSTGSECHRRALRKNGHRHDRLPAAVFDQRHAGAARGRLFQPVDPQRGRYPCRDPGGARQQQCAPTRAACRRRRPRLLADPFLDQPLHA